MAKRVSTTYERNVFVNCPFDSAYLPLFHAMIFAIQDCGFLVRSALEIEDSGEVRAAKIIKIIKDCSLGVHDISRTELTPEGLPRFNMPYELGLFIGCTVFGSRPFKNKKALILDREPHRYSKFLSDIAGQDIQHHSGDIGVLIKKVRNWLASHSKDARIPGGDLIGKRFEAFSRQLPGICRKLSLSANDLDNYQDYHNCVTEWLIENRESEQHGSR